MKRLAVVAVLIAVAVAPASAREHSRTLIKATAQHDTHWKIKLADRLPDGSLCLDVHERGPSGSGIYGCQSNKAPCENIGISNHGVGQVVEDGEITGQLLTTSGQVTRAVHTVKVRVTDEKGSRQVRAKVKFISKRDARVLDVKRFGWWFAALDHGSFDGKTTATALGANGRALGPSAVFTDGDFSCE